MMHALQLPMKPRLVLVAAFLATLALAPCAPAQQTIAWRPVLGVEVGAPYAASVYLGAGYVTSSTPDQLFRSIAGIAEVGVGGGQLAIAHTTEAEALIKRYQAAVVRSWGHTWEVAPGQTFVSVQGQWSYVLGVNIGAYWRVQGRAPDDAFVVAARLVIGF